MATDKPTWRGVLHQHAAPFALGAGVVLAAMAPTARAALAAGVFAASLFTLFTVSAIYHRVTWSEEARRWWRRADHASIFVLIAGTYTPVALLGLPARQGNTMFIAVWTGALLGVLKSLFWAHSPKWLTALLALAVGWTMAPFFGDVRRALGGHSLALILAGGIAYTVGALAYASKRPNPRPGVFGYHEVFHACTLVGAACHLALVVGLLR